MHRQTGRRGGGCYDNKNNTVDDRVRGFVLEGMKGRGKRVFFSRQLPSLRGRWYRKMGGIIAIKFLRFKSQIALSQGLVFSDKTGHMIFKDSIDIAQWL